MKFPLVAASDGTLYGGANRFSAAVTGPRIDVTVSDVTGYQPEKYPQYSSKDRGYGGNRLDCTFKSPETHASASLRSA